MSSFRVSSKWAFFFFFFVIFLAGRNTVISQTLNSTLPISRLTFPHRLLSSREMVKHHRSARLPKDKQAAEHTPILQTPEPEFAAFISQLGVRHTPHLWEKHLRHELWCCVFCTPFSSPLSAQIKKTSDAWNLLRFSWCRRLLDAVTRRHCFPSHFTTRKVINVTLHAQKRLLTWFMAF